MTALDVIHMAQADANQFGIKVHIVLTPDRELAISTIRRGWIIETIHPTNQDARKWKSH